MANEAKYWILANKAAKELGWLPETIFTQWTWETAHFTSNNLLNNNNIAGQTYYAGCGHSRGSARPKAEGGYYIKYTDAAQGYVEFIKKNIERYADVAKAKTVEEQFKTIAGDGWATDKHYADGLIGLHHDNIRHGFYKLPTGVKEPARPVVVKAETPSKPKAPVLTTYKVVSGDNLTKIAKKFKTTIDNLVKLNKLPNKNDIKLGQVLKVPKA